MCIFLGTCVTNPRWSKRWQSLDQHHGSLHPWLSQLCRVLSLGPEVKIEGSKCRCIFYALPVILGSSWLISQAVYSKCRYIMIYIYHKPQALVELNANGLCPLCHVMMGVTFWTCHRVMIRGQDTPTSMLDNLWALWEMAFSLVLCGSPAVFAAFLEPDNVSEKKGLTLKCLKNPWKTMQHSI